MTEVKKKCFPRSSFYTSVTDDNSVVRLLSHGIRMTSFSPDDLPLSYYKAGHTDKKGTCYLRSFGIADILFCCSSMPGECNADRMYVSYRTTIKECMDECGFREFYGYDVCVFGDDIRNFLPLIRKNSGGKLLDDCLNRLSFGGRFNG